MLLVCLCLRPLLSGACFLVFRRARARCWFYRLVLCLSFLAGPRGFAIAMLLSIRVWLPISHRFRLPLPTNLCLLLVHLRY